MPFGLKTSGAALIRGLGQALYNLDDFLVLFVDDLVVSSTSFDEHLQNLRQVYERLLKNNLRLNFQKTKFFCNEIEFLGHIISEKGIRPDPEKIRTIKNFKEPRNVRELQSFLGFINFYSKFTRKFADAITPLLELLRKKVNFEWTDKHRTAFVNINSLFDDNIILKYADPSKPYILTTDASEIACAAILSQLNSEGEEEIVCFVSRTFKGSEQSYFTTEKEMLALVWSLTRLDTFLRGACKIIVRTDHEALTFLRTCKFNNARLQRWNLGIQDYNIYPEYIPGKRNTVSDYLSRLDNDVNISNKAEIIITAMIKQKPSKELINICTNLKELQNKDTTTKQIIKKLNDKDENVCKRFALKDSWLVKLNKLDSKIYIPQIAIEQFITSIHIAYGHMEV